MFGVRRAVGCYEKSVGKYEQQPIETGKILFYGHSLFTRWSEKWGHRPLEEDIRKKDGSSAAINHGMGGSTAEDLLYYYHRMVKPYAPSVLVLATGANDIDQGYSAWEIMNNLARVIDYTRVDFPDIPIYCFTSFPTPKHAGEVSHFTRILGEFNILLEDYCRRKPGCICVHLDQCPFLYPSPQDIGRYDIVREDIFAEDRNHFNQTGYDLFADYIRELLDAFL